MSDVKELDPTAGGDASVAETRKIDCTDSTISETTVKPECTDVVPENAVAPEEVVATLSAQTEAERSAEVTNSANVLLAEEIANSDTHSAETIDTIVDIVHAVPENVTDVQKPAAEVENLAAATLQNEETLQKSVIEEKADKPRQNPKDNNTISRLEAEVRVRKSFESVDFPERNKSLLESDNEKRTKERDSYRNQLEDTETKLAALKASYNAITSHGSDEDILQRSVEQLRGQLAQTALMYEERNRMVANQENQINALNNQVTSLKEVVSITRDLLQIRNIEVKQLQAEVDNMEKKITEERDRHNAMISKMDAAMRLNADLKKEYETQLSLFQSLREKYGEKITLLSAEKRALETAASAPE
ncbi:tropomyosin isoform X1 [Linepithema humile]|uniref:tropomyosin isoform X1 n=1 Tax=Linepithema humile TaxID=83485 RepID=UPI00351F206F